MVGKARDPKILQKALGYTFKNKVILTSALTHASIQIDSDSCMEDNERLEFLGDRVLGLVVSAMLMKALPKAKEGELARRYNSLVRRKTCAEIGFDLELGEYLILSTGEERSGGRQKMTIIANAMEALLGAVFLDGGYAKAEQLIEKLWSNKLDAGASIQLDAKTALQEWVQGQGFDLPIYKKVDRKGPDHKPQFVVEVTVEGLGEGRGEGSSIRTAEQRAATDLLCRENVWEGGQE